MRDRAFEAAVEAEMLKLENLVKEHGCNLGWAMYATNMSEEEINRLGGVEASCE